MFSIKYTAIGQRGLSWPDNQSSQNTPVAVGREGPSLSLLKPETELYSIVYKSPQTRHRSCASPSILGLAVETALLSLACKAGKEYR